MKVKNSVLLVLTLVLLVTPLILAQDTVDDTLKIRIYNVSTIPNFAVTEIEYIDFKVEFSSEEDDFNDKTFDLRLYENASLDISFENIPYRVIITDTAENIDFAKEYYECIAEKYSLNQGYNICAKDRDECLEEYEGANATAFKTDLAECNLLIKEKDLVLAANNEKITDLKDEKESTKNSHWLYGIVGLVLGAGGFYLYNKNKGGGSPKDKSMDEWPKGQAG